MKVKDLAVIVTTENGTAYQVALSDEQIEVLKTDLVNLYFHDGTIKVFPDPLLTISIINNTKDNNNLSTIQTQ